MRQTISISCCTCCTDWIAPVVNCGAILTRQGWVGLGFSGCEGGRVGGWVRGHFWFRRVSARSGLAPPRDQLGRRDAARRARGRGDISGVVNGERYWEGGGSFHEDWLLNNYVYHRETWLATTWDGRLSCAAARSGFTASGTRPRPKPLRTPRRATRSSPIRKNSPPCWSTVTCFNFWPPAEAKPSGAVQPDEAFAGH